MSVRPKTFSERGSEQTELFEKVRDGTATTKEIAKHNEYRQKRIQTILDSGVDIFDITEIELEPPKMARIFNDVICEKCGEPVMATKIKEIAGKKLCIPCTERSI